MTNFQLNKSSKFYSAFDPSAGYALPVAASPPDMPANGSKYESKLFLSTPSWLMSPGFMNSLGTLLLN